MLFDAKNVELDKVINQGNNHTDRAIEDRQKEKDQKEETPKKLKAKKNEKL